MTSRQPSTLDQAIILSILRKEAGVSGARLPTGFDRWAERIEGHPDGYAFAHEAILSGYALPPSFNAWEVRCRDGDTVAHLAARRGYRFPNDFDGWGLANKDGDTVAHISAGGCLVLPPIREDILGLRNAQGRTVAHELAKSYTYPPALAVGRCQEIPMTLLEQADAQGVRVIDVARKHCALAIVAMYERRVLQERMTSPAPRSKITKGSL